MDQNRKEVGGKFNINGKVYTIYGGVNPVGRNREAIVNIKSLGVSQQHAQFILVDEDLHFVCDLKSSNGTYVNNKKLVPLHLHRLDKESRVKFGDIEGVYTKLTLNDVECQIDYPNSSETTQNYTQNFYGSDTQIMDNTTIKKNDNTSPEKSYIASQDLAEMADKLENSYIEAHEQATQVLNSESIGNKNKYTEFTVPLPKNSTNGNNCNESNFDCHEAETQVIPTEEAVDENTTKNDDMKNEVSDLHEADTQVIENHLETETSEQSLNKLRELEIKVIALQSKMRTQIDTINNVDIQQDEQTQVCNNENSKDSTADDVILIQSQDDDPVMPLGLCSNVLNDSKNTLDSSLDDSDIVRPVRKSVNIFNSQDSAIEDIRESSPLDRSNNPESIGILDNGQSGISKPVQKNESQSSLPEKSELNQSDKPETTGVLDDSDTDIRPMKKSINIFESQESEDIEEDSNDSVDFLTMQKVQYTQRYSNSEESPKNNPKEDGQTNNVDNVEINTKKSSNKSIVINDGSETEDECVKNFPGNEKDKEINLTVENSHSSLKKSESTGSETEIEENTPNSENTNNRRKKKLNLKRKKKNTNIISDSETDEGENEDKMPLKVVSICSDSDTEIEDNGGFLEKNEENRKNNESIGLVLEESAVEELPKNPEKPDDNEEITVNWNTSNRISMGYNESMNDSDFIPSTQENNLKSISQNSKFENSENSFKLGLTQLMEEDSNTSQPNKISESQGSEKNEETYQNQEIAESSQKKFTFKKSSLGVTKQADITLDYEEDIYQANTQITCEEKTKSNNPTDDHVFIQPTQEAPKKLKQNKNDSIAEEEIYLLATQQFEASPNKSNTHNFQQQSEDFYQQSTQLVIDEGINESRMSENELYHLPTQKIAEKDITNSKNNEEEDIFATQAMNVNQSTTKCLESELEDMFATQRALPLDDTLDEIQGIVLSKGLTDDKLPSEDKDLEAILATQKMLDSPKTPKKNKKNVVNTPEKSIESQLEVIFASQTCNSPADKFVRPPNPLVNIFGVDTQDTQEQIKESTSTMEESKSTEDEESIVEKPKKANQVGLEQSFALLEAKSMKTRRSKRGNDSEEITVSCPKSRVSMMVAPNDKILEEEPSLLKNKRTSRKRQPTSILENSKIDVKEPRRSKRRRMSESSNASDEENHPNIPSGSNGNNLKNKLLCKIQEDPEDLKIPERPDTPSKRSSRIKKKVEKSEPATDEYTKTEDTKGIKSNKSRTSRAPKISECSSDTSKEDIVKMSSEDSIENFETKVGNKNIEIKTEAKKSSRSKTSRVTKISDKDSEKDTNREEHPKNTVSSKSSSKKIINDSKESLVIEEVNKKKPVDTNLKKLKDNTETPSTPSRTSKRGCTIEVTTPPKICKVSEATPSRSRRNIDVQGTPSRTKRKLKPKVVFTMMENTQLESQIKLLGGSVVDSVDSCTVLMTKSVKRSMKLLSAVGLGKPICSEEWVLQSKKEKNFLDPWDYILVDKEAEKKWDFSLKTSLERSLQAKLFEGFKFQILVTNALDVLKGAIETCGGKIVLKIPKGANNFVVVASPDQKDKYKKLLKQQSNIIIVEPEAIFDGVLRQEIRFERHLLN